MSLVGRRTIPWTNMVLPVLGVIAALVCGALNSLLPPGMLLIAAGAIVVSLICVGKPHLGLLAVMVMVFNVIPEDYQPGVGKLRAYDVAVVFLTAATVFRMLSRRKAEWKHLNSLLWPLLYLLAALTVSFLHVRYYSPNEMALSEARAQFMWLLLPLIAINVDTRERFKQFVVVTFLMGVVVAVYVSIESMFQVHILSAALVMPLDVMGNADIVRSMSGGATYILIFSLFLAVNLMLERSMPVWMGIVFASVLCLGLAMQYGRGVWVATLVGLLISAKIYAGWRGVIRICLAAVVAVGALIGVLEVVKPRVADALIERAVGIGDELESGGSFGFRKLENSFALTAIEKHPVFGVGIGGIYKPTVSAAGSFQNETLYIHNSWLWFPLKLGLWATFIPFVFILGFSIEVRRGLQLRIQRAHSSPWFIGTVAGAFAVPVITSYTQPEWASPQGIAALAVLAGCALLYGRFGSPFDDKPVAPKTRR